MDTINFKPSKVFARAGRKFLYSVETGALYEIDDRLEYALSLSGSTVKDMLAKLVNDKNMTVVEATEMLKNLANAGLVISANAEEQKESNGMNLCALTLMVSQECNMRCAHCYGDCGEYNNKGMMTSETAIKAIDYLVENTKEDKLAIAFLGGEPLLNFSLIKEVVEYCSKISSESNKKFSYTITTNGTLLNDEIEKFLIDNNIKTQISIDGTKNNHDRMRYFKHKKPSYDIVVDKTKSMREKKLLTARATLSPENLDYVGTFKHLNELGFVGIPIEPAKNLLGEIDLETEYDEYKKYAEFFKEQVKNQHYDIASKMTDFNKAMEKIDNATKRNYGCGAFHRMYAVDIDGSLYPCHRFVGHPEFSVGNIFDNKKNDVEKWHHVDSRDKCSSCWMKNLCGGGCAYENYVENGSINISSAEFCKHMNLLYKTAIDVYIDSKYISAG